MIPLLPFLLCALVGCLCVSEFSQFYYLRKPILFFGITLFLIAATVKIFFFWRKKSVFKIPFFLACAATFFTFFSYAFYSVCENPYPNFCADELKISICIDEISTGQNDSRYGVGTIVSAPEKFENLKGMKVWYVVGDGKKAKVKNLNFIRSQIVFLSGVLQPVRPEISVCEWTSDYQKKSAEFERYLARRFIFYKISSQISGAQIQQSAAAPYIFFDAVRLYMERSLGEFFFAFQNDSEPADTYCAMLLGDKSRLTKNQKNSFAHTGTMHVFAISGLHVGFAAALLYFILSVLRIPRIASPFVALSILFLYVEACGGRPSAMRAFMMIAIFWLALALKRGAKPWNALILAAFIALLISPPSVFDAGFALSYAVVASIFLYGVPLAKYWDENYSPAKYVPLAWRGFFQKMSVVFFSLFVGAFAISIGAFFAGAPLGAYYFSYIAPMSLVYSPVFVLGAGFVVGLGFAGFFVPAFIAQIFNSAAWFLVWAMSEFAQSGNSFADLSVAFSLRSGFICVVSLFAFLGLSGFLEFSSARKRFILPPLICFAILALAAIVGA